LTSSFAIGARPTVIASGEGRLYLFANDLPLMYWNNSGALDVEIT
jgi:hypothetical protein